MTISVTDNGNTVCCYRARKSPDAPPFCAGCIKHFPSCGSSSDIRAGIAYGDRSCAAFERADFLPFEAGSEANEIPLDQIDASVLRILQWKQNSV